MKKLLPLILVLILFTACYAKADDLQFSFKSIELKETAKDYVVFDIKFEVYNPTNYKANIEKIEYNLNVNEEKIGSGTFNNIILNSKQRKTLNSESPSSSPSREG